MILSLAGINHNGLMTNGMSWGGVYADTVKNLCLPVIKLKASAVKLRFQSQNRILIGFIVKRNGIYGKLVFCSLDMKISIYKAVQIIDMVPVEMGKNNIRYLAALDSQIFQLFINSITLWLHRARMVIFSGNFCIRHSCIDHNFLSAALYQKYSDRELYKALHIIEFVYAVVI